MNSYREWAAEVDRAVAESLPGKRAKDLAIFDGPALWSGGWSPQAWASALLAQHRAHGPAAR